MNIVILDLGRFRYGGIPTYSYHLKKALEYKSNIRVIVISHRDKCYIDKRIRIGDKMLAEIMKYDLLLINGCFIDKKDKPRIFAFLNRIKIPKHLIVHDPAENLDILKECEIDKIITISKRNARYFSRITEREVNYTIHPYKRWSNDARNKRKNVSGAKKIFVSTSRVDFDKYYENILRAADKGFIPRYEIHTGYVHRPYVYFKLDKKQITEVDWKRKYYINYVVGGFEFTRKGFRSVYDRALGLIDLSFIKNDGARSQYTFLEAFDFGVPIILSRKWDPMEYYWQSGMNCLTVNPDSVKSIARAVKRLRKDEELRACLIRTGYKTLKRHSYKRVGRKFQRILEG